MFKIYTGKMWPSGSQTTIHVFSGRNGEEEKTYPLEYKPFHSVDGYSWGSVCAGSSDLARAIIIDLIGDKKTNNNYCRALCEIYLGSQCDGSSFKLNEDRIREVIKQVDETKTNCRPSNKPKMKPFVADVSPLGLTWRLAPEPQPDMPNITPVEREQRIREVRIAQIQSTHWEEIAIPDNPFE